MKRNKLTPAQRKMKEARGAVSLVSEPFGLGFAKGVPQWRLSSREQQPRPPAPKKRGRGR
jgi:hypothetical protein